MKIKFIKEYRAFQDFEGSFEASNIYKVGDTKDVDTKAAQWLIDNGFAEEVKESGWWKPGNGGRYYYVNDDGEIIEKPWLPFGSPTDEKRFIMGNCFRSNVAAERYRDYLKAIATIRQDEGVLTPEQVNERIKNEDLAYYVGYMGNRGNGEVLCGCVVDFEDCWMPVGAILFDSEVHADRSLCNHPDEWKIIVNYDWSKE